MTRSKKALDRPEARSLLRCILDAPANDVPRLILADWLDEHGQPERAELIRLQCELAALAEDDPRRFDLEGREWEPLLLYGDDWCEGLPDWLLEGRPRFERGFVAGASLTAKQFLRQAETLLGLVPLQRIHIRSMGRQMAALAASAHLGQFTSLRLSGSQLSAADLRILTGSPHLGALRELDLSNCALDEKALEVLAAWPGLARITHLNLGYNNDRGQRGLRALAASPHLTGLRSLDLTAVGIDEGFARDLARSPVLANLEHLNLSAGRLGPGGLGALVSSGLKSIGKLVLRSNSLDNEAVSALTAARIESLRALDLSENRIGQAGAEMLANCSRLAGLTALNLYDNAIGPEGAAAVASSPHLGNLRLLNLSDNRLGNEGVAALASSPHLANLRTLLLHNNEFDKEAVRLLASSRYLGSLRHMGISWNEKITRAEWEVLRESPHLPRLALLDVNFVVVPIVDKVHPVQPFHREDGRPFFTR